MAEKKGAAKGEKLREKEEKAEEKAEPRKPKQERRVRCSTCGITVESDKVWVEFRCPSCRKETIVRCERCKRLENSYKCSACGFIGP